MSTSRGCLAKLWYDKYSMECYAIAVTIWLYEIFKKDTSAKCQILKVSGAGEMA